MKTTTEISTTPENLKLYTVGVPLDYCKFIYLLAGDVISISEGKPITLNTKLAEDINKAKPEDKKAIKVLSFKEREMPDPTKPPSQVRTFRLWWHKGTGRGFIPIIVTTVDGTIILDTQGEGINMCEHYWIIKGENSDAATWKPCIRGLYRSWLEDTVKVEQEVLKLQQDKVQELQDRITEFGE